MSADKDIVDLVLEDHTTVKTLYKELHDKKNADSQHTFEELCWNIAVHAVTEEMILYPMQENMDKEGQKLAEESRKDHEKTKAALKNLEGALMSEPGVPEKVDEMMKDLLEHIEKEETADLIKVREGLSTEELRIAGKQFGSTKTQVMERMKKGKGDDHAKSPFKTPFGLVSSVDKLKKLISTEKDHGDEEDDEEAGKKPDYNLRHRDGQGHVVLEKKESTGNAGKDNHEKRDHGKVEGDGDGADHHGKKRAHLEQTGTGEHHAKTDRKDHAKVTSASMRAADAGGVHGSAHAARDHEE